MTYEYTFNDIEEIKTSSFTYYKFKNFTKKDENSQGLPVQKFSGKYFILCTDDFMWHYLSEQLTQYELLSKEIPDLQLFFINLTPWAGNPSHCKISDFIKEIKRKDNLYRLPYFEDMAKIYLKDKYDDAIIYSYTDYNFMLEEFYMIFDLRHFISDREFKIKKIPLPYYLKYKIEYHDNKKYTVYEHSPWSDLNNLNALWQREGMRLARERFRKYLKKDNELPKKIYIDRTDANIKWSLIEKDSGGVAKFKDRQFRREYIIREYFKKLGYVPLKLGEYGYIEQLNFFYNATHVAGLCGTGLVNAFVSEKGTTITELYVDKRYQFSYGYLTEIAPVNVITIDLRISDDEDSCTLKPKSINYLNKYREAGML